LAQKLVENRVWCVDGTFSVVPQPYMQLYTIGIIKNNHIFPCIFALFKNKKQKTYLKLYSTISSMINNLNPTVIKVDFEFASIQALKRCFPYARISGWQFHLSQSIQRKIKSLGLSSVYNTSTNIKKWTKALSALSYVKPDQVISNFYALNNHDNFPIILQPI
jgi:hypothetical protein